MALHHFALYRFALSAALILAVGPLFAQSGAEQSLLRFTENKNQWPQQVLYRAAVPSGYMYVEKNGFTFDLANPLDLDNIHYIKENNIPVDPEDIIINHHSYKLFLDGSSGAKSVHSEGRSKDYANYLIGKDQNKWATQVRHFNKVVLENVYEGIDLHVQSNGNNPKYDFVVEAGANPENIRLRWEGLDNIQLENNTLRMQMSFTSAIETSPVCWQIIDNIKIYVPCNYVLEDNIVSFDFPDDYDANYPLIIDPEMIFTSYSGSSADNWGYTATYDLEGHLYGGGIVFGSGYPTTVGAYDVSFNGGDIDMGISKFSADGADLIWSTYIGGSGSDAPHSLISNAEEALFIYGTTSSDNFPVTAGAFDETFNGGPLTYISIIEFDGVDIAVCKLSSDGTSIEYGTYLGGSGTDGLNTAAATEYNYGDVSRGEIFLDAAGDIYVASSTESSDFPVTAGSYDETYNGSQDGIAIRLSPDLSTVEWATYLGGSSADGAYSIKVTTDGNAAVAGGTASTGFPTISGAWNESYLGGTADGFVCLISPDGSSLTASTFAGTNQYDQAYFVELDDDNEVYITGQTKGSFPVSADVYSNTGGKQFIAKLSQDLSSAVYSTVFGSGSSAINISPSAFLVDECENVYVSGWGGSVNNSFNPATGTTSGMPVSPDALDATTDGSDFYFFVLEKNGASLLYGSYFGGTPAEHVDGGTSRFDKQGTIYQAVCAGCGGSDAFPTTDGAWAETNGSFNCNLGVGKININLGGVYAISDAEPDINGCAPFTVYFDNLSSDAEDYIWDFGDGVGGSTAFEPIYTYTDTGTYTVTLIVIDSSSCNIADTTSLVVTVFGDSIFAGFDYTTVQDCDDLVATFTNTTELSAGSTVFWDFGDGSTSTLENPEHTYTESGTYEVTQIVYDPMSCNGSDTATITLSFLTEFSEDYNVSTSGCLPVTATFTSEFVGADSYTWDFGGGITATGPTVVYTFDEIGAYSVILTVVYCGIADVTIIPINVYGYPDAFFDSYPMVGLVNTPVTFNNLSTNAVSYDWFFSDGGYSDEENPEHTFTTLGGFEVCLTATNVAGCEDTYCRAITIESEGAVGVPSAFSPNGDGSNEILFVRGFGIKTLDFRVYNRWGQEVFATSDQNVGWDGTFNGVLQEMEVYIYTLGVEFMDGKTYEEHGNVTLLY